MRSCNTCTFLLLMVCCVLVTACSSSKRGYGKPPAVTCDDGDTVAGDVKTAEVDCSTFSCSDAHIKNYPVDDFLDGTDADPYTCVRQSHDNSPVTVSWESISNKKFSINSMYEGKDGKGKRNHPFTKDPKTAQEVNGVITSPPLDTTRLDKTKCYVFKTQFRHHHWYGDRCYDPHIYVGCDGCVN